MERMLTALAFIILATSMMVKANPLQILTMDHPPYNYKEDNQLKGMAVEIVREAFARINHPINIEVYPWARALSYIETGRADALFTALKKGEREAFSDYSQVMMVETVSLFVTRDSQIGFDGNLSSLSQYTFGAIRGFSYGPTYDNAVKNKVITKIKLATKGEQAVQMLLHGRFQVLVSDRYFALYLLNKLNKTDQVRELLPYIDNTPTYMIFSKKRNLASIRDQFDKALAKMKLDGSYHQIINNYFKMTNNDR